MQASAQLLFQPQQSFAVYPVLVPVIGLGFEQALDVERANLHPIHCERSHMILQAFIGLPIGSEKQIDQQLVGDTNIFRLACRRSEPFSDKFLT